MSTTFIEQTWFVTECCITCGVAFAMPHELKKQKQEDKTGFYCPNGHSMVYRRGEADKLKDELQRERQRNDQLEASRNEAWAQRNKAERRVAATKGVITKIRKRLVRGKCPCCNSHFADLEKHINVNHPHYRELTIQQENP